MLFAGARSSVFEQVLNGINVRVKTLRTTSLSKPGRPQETLAELRAVVEAIVRRDADTAARLNALHVFTAGQIAITDLRRRQAQSAEAEAS